jgi:outer membrane protein
LILLKAEIDASVIFSKSVRITGDLSMKYLGAAVAAFAALALATPAAHAQAAAGHFQLTLGVSGVLPDEKASPIPAEIDDAYVPTAGIEYFFTDNISAELLCCAARHHVTAANGALNLGHVTHFPPTVTVKYHWTNLGNFEPYVGAGVNYTHFFNVDAPAGLRIDYSDSWGGAVQAGFDYRLNDRWAVNVDARRIWISTDVKIRGAVNANDSVDVNPWVLTTGVAYRF